MITPEAPPRPTQGWQAALYTLTGGKINPGISEAQRQRDELRKRITRELDPLQERGPYKIVCTSLKGGVGKTTVAAGLALVLADIRDRDQIVAVDANPHVGTLWDRLVPRRPGVTIHDFLADLDDPAGVYDIKEYIGYPQDSRLAVMAGYQHPVDGETFAHGEHHKLLNALGPFFDLAITDGGTGLVDAPMKSTLQQADSIVVVANPTVDAASHAAKTLGLLDTPEYRGLKADCIAVFCGDRTADTVDRDALLKHFAGRCRAVIEMPPDKHLASGGLIRLEELRPETHDALLQLADLVTDAA